MQATEGGWVTAIFSITGRDGQEITEGNEYYVHRVSRDGSIILDCDDDIRRAMEPKYFKPSVAKDTTEQEEPMDRSNWRSYSFNVRSLDQIDHQAIEEDLSWNNPLMVLEYGAKRKVFVYIADAVWRKADSCGMHEELSYFLMGTALSPVGWKMLRSDLPKLIDMLKHIKRAQWGNPRRCECTVTKIKI